MFKIACSQYQIQLLSNWQNYVQKIRDIVSLAKKSGAELLILPEYAGIEIACHKFDTDVELYESLQALLPQYLEFYQNLACEQKIYILPGTIVERDSSGKYINRAYFFQPNGNYGYQDKLFLTEYEKSIQVLQKGKNQTIFDTNLGKIGISICYDSEFPEIVRNFVRQNVSLILVPSYCTSLASFHRVFLSCRARAIENQCYVAVSHAVNLVHLSHEPEITVGKSCILGPVDTGFPDDGIIAQGKMNDVSLVTAEISLNKIDYVRKTGQVRNFEDFQNSFSKT